MDAILDLERPIASLVQPVCQGLSVFSYRALGLVGSLVLTTAHLYVLREYDLSVYVSHDRIQGFEAQSPLD